MRVQLGGRARYHSFPTPRNGSLVIWLQNLQTRVQFKRLKTLKSQRCSLLDSVQWSHVIIERFVVSDQRQWPINIRSRLSVIGAFREKIPKSAPGNKRTLPPPPSVDGKGCAIVPARDRWLPDKCHFWGFKVAEGKDKDLVVGLSSVGFGSRV